MGSLSNNRFTSDKRSSQGRPPDREERAEEGEEEEEEEEGALSWLEGG